MPDSIDKLLGSDAIPGRQRTDLFDLSRQELHRVIKRLVQIEMLVDSLEEQSAPVGASSKNRSDSHSTISEAGFLEILILSRRMREALFLTGMFNEPAWSMMLDLYYCYLRGEPVPVSSLCVAANAPSTTAFRRIDAMEAVGLVRRSKDRRDGRRVLVNLTDQSVLLMEQYIQSLQRAVLTGDVDVMKRVIVASNK